MTADLDIGRLRKLCGMFGSAHDGEIANAARMADRMLREAGLGWGDVLQTALPPPRQARGRDYSWPPPRYTQPQPDEPYGHWRMMVRLCAARLHLLSGREVAFIGSLRHRGADPTERQLAWLTAIYDRVTA